MTNKTIPKKKEKDVFKLMELASAVVFKEDIKLLKELAKH